MRRNAMALLTVAYGLVSLASFMAVYRFANALIEMVMIGGGISSIAFGMGAAARFPLIAASIAAVATLAALTMGKRANATSATLWPVGLSLAGAVLSVLVFRGVAAYVLQATTPGTRVPRMGTSMTDAAANVFAFALIAIAFCFAVTVVLFLRTLRLPEATAHLAPRFAAATLVASLAVSATLVVYLQSYSVRSLQVASADRPLRDLPDMPPHPDLRPPQR